MKDGLYNIHTKEEGKSFLVKIKSQSDGNIESIEVRQNVYKSLKIGNEILVIYPTVLAAYEKRDGSEVIFLVKRFS